MLSAVTPPHRAFGHGMQKWRHFRPGQYLIAIYYIVQVTPNYANVVGRLVPNGLPTGSKAEMRRWIDLTNEAQHSGFLRVGGH